MSTTVDQTKNAILVVSFGTSYNDSREKTIGAIEQDIAAAFPGWSVRRAFTSRMIIQKLKERDGYHVDTIKEALDCAVKDGIQRLILQPTHLMDGNEYMKVAEMADAWQTKFECLAIGVPLLYSESDIQSVIQVITEDTKSFNDGQTAICLMGHGSDADANVIYSDFQQKLRAASHRNYYIGTVEADPTLEQLLEQVQSGGNYEKVLLQPLMVVAGDHANNDMAGEEDDSWKSTFEKAGYDVTCIIKGLGELAGIRRIYVRHVEDCIESCLNEH